MAKLKSDDLVLDSGLADDFDGAIVDAWFDIRPDYAVAAGSQDPMLILAIESPDLGQTIEQAYSIGGAKQWQATKGGKEVVSGKNPDTHKFNMSSRAGTLVDRMFQTVGGGDKAKGQVFFLKRDHYMTEAEFYTGNYHWKRESMKTVGGESRDVLLPVVYLGESKAAVKPVATTGAIDEDITRIQALAEGKTERELKQAILKDETLKGKQDLLNLIFNKGLLTTLEQQAKLAKTPEGKYV